MAPWVSTSPAIIPELLSSLSSCYCFQYLCFLSLFFYIIIVSVVVALPQISVYTFFAHIQQHFVFVFHSADAFVHILSVGSPKNKREYFLT